MTHYQEQPPEFYSGNVIAFLGNQVLVTHPVYSLIPCFYKRNQEMPVVGDRVQYVIQGQQGVIEKVEPRSHVFFRVDKKGNKKPLAANISQVMVVQAANQFSFFVLDRYLVALALMNIPAVIVLNKIDLINDVEKKQLHGQLESYEKIGYPIIWTSTHSEEQLDAIKKTTRNQMSILVGPSGVGKSSLIASLSGENIATQAVSKKGTGKHTTTTTRMYALLHGGYLIDAFGVREFRLWKLSRDELLRGFIEFIPYLIDCQYKNCQHRSEKGCQLLNAIAEKKVSQDRFDRFNELAKEYVI